jgi:hypothetical protein
LEDRTSDRAGKNELPKLTGSYTKIEREVKAHDVRSKSDQSGAPIVGVVDMAGMRCTVLSLKHKV